MLGTIGKDAGASRTEMVVGHIQDGVLSGRLAGGSRLPTEDEIARTLKISRTPVREAIKILEAVGVVEIRRGVGTFVREEATLALGHLVVFQTLLEKTTPKELTEARFMIERTAAELAARNRTESGLARMADANARLKRLAKQPTATLEDLTEADIAFHHAVYDAGGNRLVAALGRFVTSLLKPLIRESLRRGGGEKAALNHDLVYQTIRMRNEGGARECSAAVAPGLDHWQRSLERPVP